MNMKRLSALILTLIMVLGMTACGAKEETPAAPATSAPATSAPAAEAEGWTPDRAIELVACYAAGGGHDILLRTMQKIIVDEGLSDATFNVVNKDGGSGAIGMSYVNGHSGDPHYLMCTTSSFTTTPLKTQLGFNYEDFTPIALLGLDPSIIVVRTDSGITNLDELLATPDVSLGGTGVGTVDHIITTKLNAAKGIEINYIPYNGDGEQVTALLGSQVTCICCNYNTVSEYINNGDFTCIATFTPERLTANPDVATAKEQGYDIEMSLYRGVCAAGNISEEEAQFYIDLMTKLNESEAWHSEYLEANGVEPHFLVGDEFKAYLDEVNAEFTKAMTEAGLI